jgi:hypothetical protein
MRDFEGAHTLLGLSTSSIVVRVAMIIARAFALHLLLSVTLAIPVLADSEREHEDFLSRTNFGKERSIFEHQPCLSAMSSGTDFAPFIRTNIYALLANPFKFAGKKVAFTGHFGRQISCGGSPMLNVYATSDDRKCEILNNSFRVFLKPLFQHQEQIELGDFVDVVGIFQPASFEKPGHYFGWTDAGSIESASIRVLPLRRFKSE